MASRKYAKMIEEAQQSPEYWAEIAIGDFTEELWRLLEEKNMSRAELARRLGTSPAYITKVLRGHANFTLASMAKIAHALDSQVRVRLVPNVTSHKSGKAANMRRRGLAVAGHKST
ncbi:MAG: helix-turn-helix transcriptional regulator [Acidobacteriota bacterium]